MFTKTIVHRVACGSAYALMAALLTAMPAVAADAPGAGVRALYVTNSTTGDISAFAIGLAGALSRLGPPVPLGQTPRGIALSPDGRTAYAVSNLGEAGQVRAYAVGADGGLTPLATTALAGSNPFGIAVAPNGRTLYVAEHDAGAISVFTIQPGGTLARHGEPVPLGTDVPNGVAVSPDGQFLYVTAGFPVAGETGRLITFAIRSDGTLIPRADPITLESAGEGITITPDGRFVYLTTTVTHNVHAYRVRSGGRLAPVAGSPFPAAARPIGAAVTPDGRHLYVVVGEFATTPNGVWGFRIGGDGALTLLADQPFESGIAPIWASATPDGRHLYAINRNTSDVSGYAIGPAGGLREIAGSPFPTGGQDALLQSLVVRPNQAPTARFGVRAGQPARFDASASTDPDGHVARYDWDFGDGSRLPDGGPTPRHNYRHPGTFTVTLTVTDNEGCTTRLIYTGQTALCNGSRTATKTHTITVTPP